MVNQTCVLWCFEYRFRWTDLCLEMWNFSATEFPRSWSLCQSPAQTRHCCHLVDISKQIMISSSLYTAENRLWSKKIAVWTIMFFCSLATSSTSMSTSIKSKSNSSTLSIFSPESTSSYLNSSLSYTKFVCSCHVIISHSALTHLCTCLSSVVMSNCPMDTLSIGTVMLLLLHSCFPWILLNIFIGVFYI